MPLGSSTTCAFDGVGAVGAGLEEGTAGVEVDVVSEGELLGVTPQPTRTVAVLRKRPKQVARIDSPRVARRQIAFYHKALPAGPQLRHPCWEG